MNYEPRDSHAAPRDWPPRRGDRFVPAEQVSTGFWRTVLAVVVALLIVGAIGWAVRVAMVYAAVRELERQAQQVSAQTAQQLEALRLQREAQARAAARAREAARQVDAQRQRAAAAADLARQEQADRKADAWARYYRPSAACRDSTASTSVECANEFIRAKRGFEEAWGAGKL